MHVSSHPTLSVKLNEQIPLLTWKYMLAATSQSNRIQNTNLIGQNKNM